MFQQLIKGLDLTLGNVQSVTYLVVSSIVGMVTGVLPGLGGPVVLSIVLALIYHISLTGVLCIFLAIHAASFFTSSITAILLNTPSHAESFAVTLDGFPMAQQGMAGRALGISAASTCIGGLIGCLCLVGFIQIMNYLPRLFHSTEYVGLITLALVLIATLGTDSAAKALVSVGVGLMIASVGQDPLTGVFRLTFGAVGLFNGVLLVPLALGMFAIPQMVLLFGVADRVARQDMTGREIGKVAPAEIGAHFGAQVLLGVRDTFRHWVVCSRAALIGVVTGLIPGIGAFAANFLSYGVAQQMSRKRGEFGTGIPEGIIAAEGSSLAKEAGGLVPLLGLGVPGGVGSALFLAALSIKGVQVGYGFTSKYPVLSYEMVWIIAFGGLLGTAIGVLAAPWLARVTMIPGPVLVPIIMSLSVVGAYAASTAFFAVMEVLVFAIVGLVLRRLRYAIAALVVALVLGPQYEANIDLTRNIFHGWSFLERPFGDVLLALAVMVLVIKVLQQRAEAARDRPGFEGLEGIERTKAEELRERQQRPYPLLALMVTLIAIGLSCSVVAYCFVAYDTTTGLMPELGGLLAIVGSLCRLPGDVGGYVHFRRALGRPLEAPLETPAERTLLDLEEPDDGLGETEQILESVHVVSVLTDPVRERHKAGYSLPEIREKGWGWSGQYSREIAGMCWFGGLIAGCFLIGFYVALPLFGVIYALLGTRRSVATMRGRVTFALFLAVVGWGQTYLIFQLLHLTFSPAIHWR